jgi:hypothetical protein
MKKNKIVIFLGISICVLAILCIVNLTNKKKDISYIELAKKKNSDLSTVDHSVGNYHYVLDPHNTALELTLYEWEDDWKKGKTLKIDNPGEEGQIQLNKYDYDLEILVNSKTEYEISDFFPKDYSIIARLNKTYSLNERVDLLASVYAEDQNKIVQNSLDISEFSGINDGSLLTIEAAENE